MHATIRNLLADIMNDLNAMLRSTDDPELSQRITKIIDALHELYKDVLKLELKKNDATYQEAIVALQDASVEAHKATKEIKEFDKALDTITKGVKLVDKVLGTVTMLPV